MLPLLVVCFTADVGFEVPDVFVVGYALDYNEYFRDLNVSVPTRVSFTHAILYITVEVSWWMRCCLCVLIKLFHL